MARGFQQESTRFAVLVRQGSSIGCGHCLAGTDNKVSISSCSGLVKCCGTHWTNSALRYSAGSVISGIGVAIENYGGLGTSPPHIAITFYALVVFATWWAATDLTTQGKSLVEVNEWVIASTNDNSQEMPKIVTLRRISNVVSCLFVLTLFSIMILKPGVIYLKEIAPLFESSS